MIAPIKPRFARDFIMAYHNREGTSSSAIESFYFVDTEIRDKNAPSNFDSNGSHNDEDYREMNYTLISILSEQKIIY